MNASLRLSGSRLYAAGRGRPRDRRCGLYACFALSLLMGLPEAQAGEVPINGRHQQLDFTSAQVRAIAATDYARRLEGFKHQGALDRDSALLARTHDIASRLIAQAVALKLEAGRWNWELHIVDSPYVDAFCMAGGKILVSSQFVASLNLSDGELAALLGHEIAHAVAEHVREQLTAVRALKPKYPDLSLEDAVNLLDRDLLVSFRLADLSRLHELEADDIGISLAVKAGFNPRSLVRFYRKLASLERGPVLVDTHDSADNRLRVVENFAAYAEVAYRANSDTRHPSTFSLR